MLSSRCVCCLGIHVPCHPQSSYFTALWYWHSDLVYRLLHGSSVGTPHRPRFPRDQGPRLAFQWGHLMATAHEMITPVFWDVSILREKIHFVDSSVSLHHEKSWGKSTSIICQGSQHHHHLQERSVIQQHWPRTGGESVSRSYLGTGVDMLSQTICKAVECTQIYANNSFCTFQTYPSLEVTQKKHLSGAGMLLTCHEWTVNGTLTPCSLIFLLKNLATFMNW